MMYLSDLKFDGKIQSSQVLSFFIILHLHVNQVFFWWLIASKGNLSLSSWGASIVFLFMNMQRLLKPPKILLQWGKNRCRSGFNIAYQPQCSIKKKCVILKLSKENMYNLLDLFVLTWGGKGTIHIFINNLTFWFWPCCWSTANLFHLQIKSPWSLKTLCNVRWNRHTYGQMYD